MNDVSRVESIERKIDGSSHTGHPEGFFRHLRSREKDLLPGCFQARGVRYLSLSRTNPDLLYSDG